MTTNQWRRCDKCDVRWLSEDETCWMCNGPAIDSQWPGMSPNDLMPDHRYPHTRRPA